MIEALAVAKHCLEANWESETFRFLALIKNAAKAEAKSKENAKARTKAKAKAKAKAMAKAAGGS